MTTPSKLTVSHSSEVTADQIDELGHMNVRYYGENATAGTIAMADRLGLGEPQLVRTYTRHHNEQMEGNQLEVRSAVLGGETENVRFFHELRNAENNDLAATFIHEIAHAPIETPGIDLPDYGQPRSIDPARDLADSAPTLEEVRERGLAIRLERDLTTEDSNGAEIVPPWLTNNLIWSGDRPDGEASWIIDTADGDRVAFASMETAMAICRPVAIGTRIQSFGAVVEVGTKISRDLNWVYAVETGELLAAAESIDLAFSIPNRRSREMAPEQRAREEARLHPDLYR